MNSPGTDEGPPPRLPDPPRLAASPHPGLPAPAPAEVPAWRRFAALLLLASYIIVPALLGAQRDATDGAMLPPTSRGVISLCATELTLFAVVFAVVAWLGRLRGEDLMLGWRGGIWLVPRAALWSVALRIGVGLMLGACLLAWQFANGTTVESLQEARPKVEALVNVAALRDPVYLGLMLTLVSFVLAGLREELWRAAMVALLGRAIPAGFGGRAGAWFAIVPVAVLFGLAHTPQGWVGVVATGLLGVGLGAVMLFHRSLWDAVFTHGFFNAATFALLPWIAQRLPDLLR